MSDTTKSLRPLVNRAPCWESEHEAIITFFTDDGDVWGFPFFGLLAAQYTARNQTLALQWQGAQVRIQGPRAHDFFMAFAKGSATGIKANGEDILSVEVILPPSPPPRRQRRERKKAPRMSKQPESSTFSFSPALLLYLE